MTAHRQSEMGQFMTNASSTLNTERFASFVQPLPLTTASVHELSVSPNQSQTNETHDKRPIGSSDLVGLDISRYLPFAPVAHQSREKFRTIQKWEGYVLEVFEETFLARLIRLEGEGPDQEAEIYLEDLDVPDRALVMPGAVFYWSIGYLDKPSGRIRASILRFRRLPGWTKGEIEAAADAAKKLKALFVAN